MGIYLWRVDNIDSDVSLNYNIRIIQSGNVKATHFTSYTFTKNSEEGYGACNIIKYTKILPFPDEVLIECEMRLQEDQLTSELGKNNSHQLLEQLDINVDSFTDLPSRYSDILDDTEKVKCKFVQTNNFFSVKTAIKIVQTELFWNVERFSLLPMDENKIIFARLASSEESCAALILNLNGEEVLQIKVLVSESLPVEYKFFFCHIDVCDIDDNIVKESEKMCNLSQDESNSLFFEDVIKKSEVLSGKEKFLLNDTLTLHFLLTFVLGPSSEHTELSAASKPKVLDTYIKDSPFTRQMRNLFISRKHCDVILRAGDQDIPAHKDILCNMSPVLDAMFDTDMKEKNTGVICVTDVDPVTLKTLLRYMYTGEIDNLEFQEYIKLFAAGDKYQVLPLICECRKLLKTYLSVKNVCDILLCADLHNDDLLKTWAMRFVCRNVSAVFSSDGWKSAVEQNPKLASEVVLLASSKLRQK